MWRCAMLCMFWRVPFHYCSHLSVLSFTEVNRTSRPSCRAHPAQLQSTLGRQEALCTVRWEQHPRRAGEERGR